MKKIKIIRKELNDIQFFLKIVSDELNKSINKIDQLEQSEIN